MNNSLSVTILTLGLLLIKTSLVGVFASNRLLGSTNEDVKASKQTMNKGFMVLAVFMKLSILLFVGFLFLAIWFIFFNTAPAQWMSNAYFLKSQGMLISVN